jgi:class 3 adenylate cyclase
MSAPEELPRTIDAVFEWLLRCATVASVLFLVKQLAFYALIARDADPAASADVEVYAHYLWVALGAAAFNSACWWWGRERVFHPLRGALSLLGNSFFVTASGPFIFGIYQSICAPLLIPTFLGLSVLAGMLGDVRFGFAVSLCLAAQYSGLILWARSQGIPIESDVLAFLPATDALLVGLAVLVSFGSQRLQRGETRLREISTALERTNAELEEAQALLSRYLAPELAQKITTGHAAEIWGHERRKLTIFFSDIKDFTATTDAMEPEDMARLLNQYIEEMLAIAAQHRGTIAQISGDGLFIFFGAPDFSSDADHALRAVRMAVAMQARMAELKVKWFESGIEHPLQIRCGINTGMTTVGGFGSEGRRHYTAIGMQTNLAARLEAACEPGQILISHTTWALIKEELPCLEMGEIQVKGFHRPLRTYRVDLDEVHKRERDTP